MRYLLDEDLSTEIARIGRRFGLDIESVHEIRREKWTDEQQLTQAAVERRCIVTANRNDFEFWSNVFFEEERSHAGVLIVRHQLWRRGPAVVARALIALTNPGEFPGRVPLRLPPAG